MLSLLCIALGAFAIGTEGFMLAGLLPEVAADLGVSVAVAGQLVTVFSLTYALGSPLLAVATGALDRKRLLMGSMVAFALGNVVAATAHGYGMLLAARIIMALAASTFMPAASAYAAAVASPERRGRALSVIYVGLTLSTVIGVPLGVLVGGRFGWRDTFAGVFLLSVLAVVGIWRMLAPVAGVRTASLFERLAVARRPDVLGALAQTALMMAGAFTVYTYLAPFLGRAAGLAGPGLALMLFLFGGSGATGNLLGGWAADRVSPRRLLSGILAGVTVTFALLSLAAATLPAGLRGPAVMVLVLLWGLMGWSFPSVQQTRLVGMAPELASVTLSLNASATYLGISVGAVLGSVAVAHGSLFSVGWLAGGCVLLALVLLRGLRDAAPAPRAPVAAQLGLRGSDLG